PAPLVVEAAALPGPHPAGGDRRSVQHREEVQLLGRTLGEPDQQALADELRDLLPHRRDRGGVAGLRRRHQASLTFSGPTPETKMSSLMNMARGPAGLVACTSTVGTLFIGQTPPRAQPPHA